MAQCSLYVHKGDLKHNSFNLICINNILLTMSLICHPTSSYCNPSLVSSTEGEVKVVE